MASIKQGYPLREIDGFDPRVLSTLRDRLSVTTAEELLHAAASYPDELARLLEVDRRGVHAFAEAAAEALGETVAGEIRNPPEVKYPFRTGHDAPAGWRPSWNEG